MNTSNSPKVIPNRIVIFAQDVMNITGRRESAARELLRKIRKSYGKAPGQFITIHEFCSYTGLKENEVKTFIQ